LLAISFGQAKKNGVIGFLQGGRGSRSFVRHPADLVIRGYLAGFVGTRSDLSPAGKQAVGHFHVQSNEKSSLDQE
jgi:hypothetical protein